MDDYPPDFKKTVAFIPQRLSDILRDRACEERKIKSPLLSSDFDGLRLRGTQVDNDASSDGSRFANPSPDGREPQPDPGRVEGGRENVINHMERCFGKVENVLREVKSDLLNLAVHVIPPRDESTPHVLFTTGISDRPMKAPREVYIERRVELMLALPPYWKLHREALKDERWNWPIRGLKTMARLTHEHQTWLDMGHTIPNGEPPVPYAPHVPFCCALITPPLVLPPEMHVVLLPNGEPLRILAPVWLHRGEVSLKLLYGVHLLFDRLDEIGASEIVDLNREDVSRQN